MKHEGKWSGEASEKGSLYPKKQILSGGKKRPFICPQVKPLKKERIWILSDTVDHNCTTPGAALLEFLLHKEMHIHKSLNLSWYFL